MKNYISLLLVVCFASNSWSQEYKEMIIKGTYTVQEIQAKAEAHFAIVGKERGKGYKPYKRWEYDALRNMDENGILKTPEFYYNELERYNQYRNNSSTTFAKTAQGTWEEVGPTYWSDDNSNGWNPGVGRITSVSVESANRNHIIVGGASGGVWRTVDGGTTWTVLTDNMSNLTVSALTINPLDNTNYFWGSSNGAIFSSTDSGSTWSLLSDTGAGTVNKILIDPTDDTKMYCSVQGGGIYKSTDSGATWTIIHALATTGYDVEFKPGVTSTIYATGNKYFKSIDGGVTFTTENALSIYQQEYASGTTNWISASSNLNNTVDPRTGNGLGLFYINNYSHPVTRLIPPVVNLTGATAPKLNFSYTNVSWDSDIDELKVLYKTSLGGTWTVLATYTAETTAWQDITLDLPNQSSEYYVAFEGKSNYGRGLTLDDVSIEDVTLGVLFENGFESNSPLSTGPKMMGVSANNPNVVYILEAENGKFGAFYRSTDSGNSFTKLNHGTNNYFGYESNADDDRGQAPRDMDIAVNPNDANDVHIAGILSWRSTNAGDTFSITSQWVPGSAANQNIGYCHADIDIMEYVGDKLYVGSDGGIFVAENPLVVNSNYYTDLSTGLGIRQFYKIGVNQNVPEVITGGAQDNGASVFTSTGVWKDWLGADGMETFVDKTNNNTLYGTTQNGSLYKSNNQGTTYFGLNSPDNKDGNWVTPFEQDPLIANRIYSGYDQVYRSNDGGSTWTAISQTFGGNLNHLKIAPSNNTIMFAAIGSTLYKTANGGITNWTTLSGFSGSINSIAIHPTDANKIAIATTGAQKVYVSTDGGVNWTSYLKNLPGFSALALVWTDHEQDGLYVGMNYGVYYIGTTDPAAEWLPFSNNLPNVQISELEINTASNKLFAGTYGRGLWKSDLFEPGALNISEFEALNTISLFPNPATNNVSLVWNKDENVSIKIYNTLGKLVYYAKDKSLMNTLKINTSDFASGLYFVNINTVSSFTTKKLIIE
ncbi:MULTISPECIES: VPS10 domain-containing protein [Flavobacterium]|uniref:T9SS type A sorting domain-containing protein n=1 Tax=Flavobacterium jumunjinense TaxID=998845 RepID=A0ABV5GNT4_9FLAO|nr:MULTISPECIES: T9SS type A sorting domain-containing protein [Flavobacterium]